MARKRFEHDRSVIRSARRGPLSFAIEENIVKVMIGVDPHKGSHTAVAIDKAESELARLKVRATRRQAEELLG